MHVQANDIKTRGVKAMTDALDDGVCIVSNRGTPVLAAIDIDKYNEFRNWELNKALAECKADIANGDYNIIKSDEDVERHMKEVGCG